MKEFEIRAATDDDQQHVIRLMGNIYSGNMSARYDWLYRSNPHGAAVTWLAIETATGEAVGCTSIFPRRVMVGNQERRGGIGGDCFIEPRMRRRGIASALHRASFSEMRERGVEFMYGPPNSNNLGALVKAGSRVVASYNRWVRPLTARGILSRARRRAPSRLETRLARLPVMVLDRLAKTDARDYSGERVESFTSEFDTMFENAASSHEVVCVRDRHYLAWKYFASPLRRQVPLAVKRDGEVVGFIALETVGEYAAIADLFTANDTRLIDGALQVATDYAAAAGCSMIELNLTEGCPVTRRLLRHGFINRGGRGFQVALAESFSQSALLLKAGSWHFTEGDLDMNTVFVPNQEEKG
jgi:hypothetical protein